MSKEAELNEKAYKLIVKSAKLGDRDRCITAAIKLLSDSRCAEELTRIFKECLAEGDRECAERAARYALYRGLTKEELETILEKQVARGWLERAKSTAVCLGRKLTKGELVSLLENTPIQSVKEEISDLLLA